jgi:hypothetical protein
MALRAARTALVVTRDARLRLVKAIVVLAVLTAIVIAMLAAAPGLGGVRRKLAHAQLLWVSLAAAAELGSCLAFVVFFRQVFWRAPRRFAARLAGAELAVNSLLPAGRAGGLGLGAWILSTLGMPAGAITIRSEVVFLVTSAVNVAAMALLGVGLAIGALSGPHDALRTLVPGSIGLLVIVLFLAIPGPLGRAADRHERSILGPRPRFTRSRPGFARASPRFANGAGGCSAPSATGHSTSSLSRSPSTPSDPRPRSRRSRWRT